MISTKNIYKEELYGIEKCTHRTNLRLSPRCRSLPGKYYSRVEK